MAWTRSPSGRVGFNNRILTIDLLTGRTHEYVYVMDAVNQGRGVNEILAINDHEFLVLERDNRTKVPTPPNAAQSPNLKRLYKIDLASTPRPTDVSGIDSLPLARSIRRRSLHRARSRRSCSSICSIPITR